MEEAGKPNLADFFPVLKKIDPMRIRQRLTSHSQNDLFTVGTDTTSFALEWAIAELLCDPEKLSKTQVELKQIIRKGKPVEEYDIGQLPYLQAIIKDTF
ncbi:unnamed protein product [Malus baccata var. baccata]